MSIPSQSAQGQTPDPSASSSGLHAGSAQWQPPVPSMAALPVDMSKTEPKPAYYKLQFGDDYTGFSYYVRTLGVVIGRKCEKPIQVPPPDIMSPQVPARPPLESEITNEGRGDQTIMEGVQVQRGRENSMMEIFPSALSLGENILDTPPMPDLSTANPPDEISALDLRNGDQTVKVEEGDGTPEMLPIQANQADDEINVKLEDIHQVDTLINGDVQRSVSPAFLAQDESDMLDLPPPPPPPPNPGSSVEHVDVDLGPLKSVSRNHAKIDFRADLGHFCLEIHGRNGAWVDDRYYVKGSAVPLYQGSVIQIATRIFSFILPPTPGGSPGTPHVLDASFDSNSPLDDVPYPYNLPASQLGYQEFFGESPGTAGPGPTTISQQVPQPFNAFTAQDGQGLGLGMEYDWAQDKRKGRHHWTEEWSSEDSEDSWDSWDESDEVEERKIHRRRRRNRRADEGESELSSVGEGSGEAEEDEDDDDDDDEEEEEEAVIEEVPTPVEDEEMPEEIDKPKKKGKAKATVPPPVAKVEAEAPPVPVGPGKGPAQSGKLPAKGIKAVKALKAQVAAAKKANGASEDVVMSETPTAEDLAKAKKAKVESPAIIRKESDTSVKDKEKEKPKPPVKKVGPKKVKAAPAPNLSIVPKMPSTPGVLIPGLSVQVTPIPPPPPRTLAAAMAASAPPVRPLPAPAVRPPPPPPQVAAVRPPPPPAPVRPPPPLAAAPIRPVQAVRPPPTAPFRPPPPPQMVRPPPVPPTQFIPHQPPMTPRPVPVHAVSASAHSTAASSPGGTPEPQKPFYLTELIETPGRPGHIIVNVPIPPSGAGPRPPPGPMIGLDGENFIGPPPIKPTATFAIIIYSALANLPRGRGTLGEVCNWIAGEWEWFRLNVDTGWQNSIRHNLSLNKAFLKVPRIPEDDPESKGSVWIIDPKEGPIFEEKQRKEAHKSEGKTRTAEMRAVRERQKVDERYRTPKDPPAVSAPAPPAPVQAPHPHPTPLPRPPPQARVNQPVIRPTPRPPAAPSVPKGPVLPKEKVTVTFDTITPAMRAESLIQTMDSNGNPLPFVCSATALVLERSAFGHLTPDIIEKLHMLGAHTAVEVLLSWVNNKNKQQLVKAAQAKAAASASGSGSGPSVRPAARPNMMAKQARPPARPAPAPAAARPPPPRPMPSSSTPSAAPHPHPVPVARPNPAPRPPSNPGPPKAGANLGAAPPGASMKVIITMIATVAAANGDVKTVGKHAVALLRYIKIVGAAIDLKAAERIWATGVIPPSIKGAVGTMGNGMKPNGTNGNASGVRPAGVPGQQGQGGMAPKPQVRPPLPPSASSSSGVRPPPQASHPNVRPPPMASAPQAVRPPQAPGTGGPAIPIGQGQGVKRKLEDEAPGVKAASGIPNGGAMAQEMKRPKLEAGGS